MSDILISLLVIKGQNLTNWVRLISNNKEKRVIMKITWMRRQNQLIYKHSWDMLRMICEI